MSGEYLTKMWKMCEYTNDLKETAGAGEEVEEEDEWEALKEFYKNIVYENMWMEINLTHFFMFLIVLFFLIIWLFPNFPGFKFKT